MQRRKGKRKKRKKSHGARSWTEKENPDLLQGQAGHHPVCFQTHQGTQL